MSTFGSFTGGATTHLSPRSRGACKQAGKQPLIVAALPSAPAPPHGHVTASWGTHHAWGPAILPSLFSTSLSARLLSHGLPAYSRSPSNDGTRPPRQGYGTIGHRSYRRTCAITAGAGTCVTGACSGNGSGCASTSAVASSPLMDMFAVVLGYACLAGSFFRSVPQIAVILRTGSAEGLSLTSNLMELLCFTVTVAYNMQQGYAFNTYGEVFACWIQDVIIVGLIFRHMRLPWSTIGMATIAFAASCICLFSPLCPMAVLSALQMSTIVVMAVGARLPQIWLNVRRGNAGVLSPLTCLLNVAGCVVRVFTTAVLTRDGIIMGGCVTQLILNAILLYQSVATPGKIAVTAADATATATAITAVAATDPPSGGAGGPRGQPAAAIQAVAATNPDSNNSVNADGQNSSSSSSRNSNMEGYIVASAVEEQSVKPHGKEGEAGASRGTDGGGGGGREGASPLPVPAAA